MPAMLFLPPQILAAFPAFSVDGPLSTWFRDRLNPELSYIFGGLSLPGCAAWITLLVCAMTLIHARRRSWYPFLTLLLVVPCGALLGETLKLIFQRPRPFLEGPFGPWGGYSFPSGHTIAATLMYGYLAMVLIPLVRNWVARVVMLIVAIGLIGGVGFSRVALGAHYLSDVMAAMVIGVIWLFICSCLVELVRRRRVRVPVPVENRCDDSLENLSHNDAE